MRRLRGRSAGEDSPVEKFLHELVNIDNGIVHSSMVMSEESARQSNEWLVKQHKAHLEWRKKEPRKIDEFKEPRE
jgi:hypothetical protein